MSGTRRLFSPLVIGTTLVAALLFSAVGAVEAKEPARTVRVDCDRGQSVGDALRLPADELVIEFSGTCAEDVRVDRDRVTLAGLTQAAAITGTPDAARAPALRIRSAQNVTLRQFTVRDSDSRGVEVEEGAAVTFDAVAVEDNRSAGLVVQRSSAVIRNSTFDGNGNDGLAAWNNSAIQLEGFVHARRNARVGFLISGGSDLLVATTGAAIVASDNRHGIHVQLGGSAQLSAAGGVKVVAERNGESGVGLLHASFTGSGSVIIRDSHTGVSIGAANALLTNLEVSGCDYGVVAFRGSTVVLDRTSATGNVRGVIVDAATAEVRRSTITANSAMDLRVTFGSRVATDGSTGGNVSCDGTVLVRGAACSPTSAAFGVGTSEQPVRAGSAAAGGEIRPLPLMPLLLELESP